MPWVRLAFALLALGALAALALLTSGFGSVLRRQSGASLPIILNNLLPVLISVAGLGVLGLLVTWWVAWRYPGLADQAAKAALAPAPSLLSGYGLCLLIALVLMTDGPTLAWGYFEADDFDLLTAVRLLPLPDLVCRTHNDHTLPLLWLEFAAMYACFGAHPFAYNLAILLTFAATLAAGGLLLAELGAKRGALILYIFLMVNWTLWGEFTTGSYILQKYMQITIAGLLAAWASVRWQRRKSGWDSLRAVASVAVAGLLNLSGFWVPAAWAVFTLAGAWVEKLERVERNEKDRDEQPSGDLGIQHRQMTWYRHPGVPILLTVIALAAVHALIYLRPESTPPLATAQEPRTLLTLLSQIGYLWGTLLLTLFVPIPHHLGDFGLLTTALFLVWGFSIGTLIVVLVMATPRSRVYLVAILLVLGGVLLMVALGRPTAGVNYVVPAKYLGPAYVWLSIFIALGWQVILDRCAPDRRAAMVRLTAAALLLAAVAHQAASVLGGMGTPFFASTRGGKWREHRLERAALDDLRSLLFAPLERADSRSVHPDREAAPGTLTATPPIVLPEIASARLGEEYPALAFTWGEQRPLSTFLSVLAQAPNRIQLVQPADWPVPPALGVLVVPDVQRAVSPAFWELRQRTPRLQRLTPALPYPVK